MAASKHGLVNSRFQERLPNDIPPAEQAKRPSSCPPLARIGLAKTRRNATISANSPAFDRLRITRRARRASRLSIMKKQIRLNAFAMNCVAHQSPGLWTIRATAPPNITGCRTGSIWRERWSAGGSTVCFSQMCSRL